jgi:hypothetical protein
VLKPSSSSVSRSIRASFGGSVSWIFVMPLVQRMDYTLS